MAPESVVLESQFLQVPMDDPQWSERLWSELDEQHLPNPLRRKLAANGLRAGIVSVQLPELLRSAIDQQQAESELLVDGDLEFPGSRLLLGHQRWQALARRRSEIVTSPIRDSMVLLLNLDGTATGRTFQQAQCKFAVRAFPRGDGSVTLHVVPEIHYGPPRQRVVGDGATFRFDSGPDREVLDALRLDVVLSLGQALALTTTSPPRGLGQQFFCVDPAQPDRRRILLIRLAQSQYDDLFADDALDGPLASHEAL